MDRKIYDSKSQLLRVRDLMADGKFRTLQEISSATGDPEASVSARLRDLRKPQFGGHKVDRVKLPNGKFEYRVSVKYY